MTEDEFRILEQRMASNKSPTLHCGCQTNGPHGVNCPTILGDFARMNADKSVEWPEHMIEAECTRLLGQDGWRALRTDPVSDRGRGKVFGELGMADYLYMRSAISETARASGWCQRLWIEFKSSGGKPAKHQIEWHTKERARGALTWIAGTDFPASVAGFVEHYRASGLNRGRI